MSDKRSSRGRQPSLLRSLFPRKQKRVLLLTGGGTRGAAQVGMLKELVNSGLEFDAVVGCSVGSLNAASFASLPESETIEELEQLWRSLRNKDIFPLSPLNLLQGLSKKPNLFGDSALRKVIKSHLKIENLSETKLPLAIMTTELLSGRSVAWRQGSALDILIASSALPGAYPPVRLDDGKLHIDGGVSSAIPVRVALDVFDATEIWALDVLGRPNKEEHQTARDVINTAFSHSNNVVAGHEIDLLRNHRKVGFHHIKLPDDLKALDSSTFARTDELIEAGSQSAKTYLEALK